MIRNPVDELEPRLRRLAAEVGLEVDEVTLAEARRFTGVPINLPRLVGYAIVNGLAEAATNGDDGWATGDCHTVHGGSVSIDGYYDIETLGRAALRALGVGVPVTGTDG